MSQHPQRLRPHPAERFADPVHAFDVRRAIRDLVHEPITGEHGHRQKTLFKHGPMTVAVFHLMPNAALPDHQLEGVTTLHVLRGRLDVETAQNTYQLTTGHMLVLSPGVRHDLEAHDESEVLMTVCLEKE